MNEWICSHAILSHAFSGVWRNTKSTCLKNKGIFDAFKGFRPKAQEFPQTQRTFETSSATVLVPDGYFYVE